MDQEPLTGHWTSAGHAGVDLVGAALQIPASDHHLVLLFVKTIFLFVLEYSRPPTSWQRHRREVQPHVDTRLFSPNSPSPGCPLLDRAPSL